MQHKTDEELKQEFRAHYLSASEQATDRIPAEEHIIWTFVKRQPIFEMLRAVRIAGEIMSDGVPSKWAARG